MTIQSEIEQVQRSVKTDAYQMSLGEICNLYVEGDLVINPDFQRLFRWTRLQKSRLIEFHFAWHSDSLNIRLRNSGREMGVGRWIAAHLNNSRIFRSPPRAGIDRAPSPLGSDGYTLPSFIG